MTRPSGVLGTALAADVLSPQWPPGISRDDVAPTQFRIDASDKDNPVYYLNGSEVSRDTYMSAMWSGSMFRPDHLKKDKDSDA